MRYEFCLRIEGVVRARPASQVNERLPTGKIDKRSLQREVASGAS